MYLAKFDDPDGSRHGLPTFNYRHAPRGLCTRRQLAAKGLTPGRQDIAAQILWRRGRRVAYLYREDLARPKQPATKAQLAALAKARTALCTCPTCNRVYDYYIPRRFGECLDCHNGTYQNDTATSFAATFAALQQAMPRHRAKRYDSLPPWNTEREAHCFFCVLCNQEWNGIELDADNLHVHAETPCPGWELIECEVCGNHTVPTIEHAKKCDYCNGLQWRTPRSQK